MGVVVGNMIEPFVNKEFHMRKSERPRKRLAGAETNSSAMFIELDDK